MVTSIAGEKISQLPTVLTALLTDVLPAVQGGVTYQESLTEIFNLFQSNLTNKVSARVATTVALTVTYNNNVNGVGATLTNADTQAALVLDGVTMALNDRVLVKNQSSTFQNGIYVVTNLGTIVTNWVMTRATDFDNSPAGEVAQGNIVGVATGTVNASTSWMETGAGPFVIGSTPIVFTILAGLNNVNLLYAAFANPDTQSNLVTFDVTIGHAALASAGSVILITSGGSKQYKIRSLQLNSGGTNFSGGGGDRLGQVTDGTTVYSVVPAATMQSLVNAQWGVTALPNPASAAINVSTVAGANLVFKYSGGTTDYSAGSLVITGLAERIA